MNLQHLIFCIVVLNLIFLVSGLPIISESNGSEILSPSDRSAPQLTVVDLHERGLRDKLKSFGRGLKSAFKSTAKLIGTTVKDLVTQPEATVKRWAGAFKRPFTTATVGVEEAKKSLTKGGDKAETAGKLAGYVAMSAATMGAGAAAGALGASAATASAVSAGAWGVSGVRAAALTNELKKTETKYGSDRKDGTLLKSGVYVLPETGGTTVEKESILDKIPIVSQIKDGIKNGPRLVKALFE